MFATAIRRGLAAGLLLLVTGPTLLDAQGVVPPDRDAEPSCLRFRFGTWTPVLDWKRSGHPSAPDSVRLPRTASGQAWAVGASTTSSAIAGDTTLVLYPGFWPAGVSISFDPRAFVANDTVTGLARAFVADASQPTSTTRATLWRVPCG